MKNCKAKVLAAAVLAAASLAHGAVNFPLGTYVYAGSVMDFRNTVQGAASGLTIYAVSTNGTVLSSCELVDPDGSGCNFRLEVPVSTFATEKSAAVGDAPNCVIESASGMRSAATTSFPPILCASAVTNCVVKYANAREFEHRGETVLVPEDYIDGTEDSTATIRRHSTLRMGAETTSSRLVGRSVWNDRWLLVIPASSLSSKRANALTTFVNGIDSDKDGQIDVPGVSDIKIGFRAYSRSGN